jgi:hypothetical protein
MANIEIVKTSKLATMALSEEDEKDFQDTYDGLKDAGSRAFARASFDTLEEAAEFASKAAAWARQNGHKYYRKDAADDKLTVKFRVYDGRNSAADDDDRAE